MAYASFSTSFGSGTKYGNLVALFQSSILLLCVAVFAMRALVAMPIDLRANWIFRVTETRLPAAYMVVSRKVFWWLCVAPVIAGTAAWAIVINAPHVAVVHLLLLGTLGWVLIELSLLRFQSIPFTCAYQPGRANAQVFFWCGVFILPPIVHGFALYESTAVQDPWRCLIPLAISGLAFIFVRNQARVRVPAEKELVYEPDTKADVQSLHLR